MKTSEPKSNIDMISFEQFWNKFEVSFVLFIHKYVLSYNLTPFWQLFSLFLTITESALPVSINFWFTIDNIVDIQYLLLIIFVRSWRFKILTKTNYFLSDLSQCPHCVCCLLVVVNWCFCFYTFGCVHQFFNQFNLSSQLLIQ